MGQVLDVGVDVDGGVLLLETHGEHAAGQVGLAGLRQRVLAADGRFDVSSPAGGPTVVSAWFPLEGG